MSSVMLRASRLFVGLQIENRRIVAHSSNVYEACQIAIPHDAADSFSMPCFISFCEAQGSAV